MSAHPTAHAHTEEHLLHDEEHGGPKLYAAILAGLLVLTVITVAASRIDWGSSLINVIIAMAIASVKASLVALFFMHLRWDRPMNAIIFCSSLFFLGLFLITCYTDNVSRPPLEPNNLKSLAIPGGLQIPAGGMAPNTGHGQPGAASPSGGGPAIPGASPEGSYGGAATGKANPPVAPHK